MTCCRPARERRERRQGKRKKRTEIERSLRRWPEEGTQPAKGGFPRRMRHSSYYSLSGFCFYYSAMDEANNSTDASSSSIEDLYNINVVPSELFFKFRKRDPRIQARPQSRVL